MNRIIKSWKNWKQSIIEPKIKYTEEEEIWIKDNSPPQNWEYKLIERIYKKNNIKLTPQCISICFESFNKHPKNFRNYYKYDFIYTRRVMNGISDQLILRVEEENRLKIKE